jgi:rsbT co-antagonist protein RsbR
MRIDQRRAQFTVILLCALASAAGLIGSLFSGSPSLIGGSAVGLLAYGGFAVASYFQQRWANLATVILSTLLTSILLVFDGQTRGEFSAAAFVAPVMALMLAGPFTVALSGIINFGVPALFIGTVPNPYTQPLTVVVSLLVLAGMTVGRAVLDTLVERSQAAEQAARTAQAEALREAQLAQLRAGELESKTVEQQRLIEVIGTLELPMVPIADSVLFLPLVGHLDSRRMQAISARLLNQLGEQRVSMVILDIAGVSVIDTQVAQHIQQLISAVGLMGAKVSLTGIRANVAHTMTELGINMRAITIARTPQEVLAGFRA